jgi:hypothetical protein
MKVEFSRQIFEKPSNVKLRENPSNGNGTVQCAGTDMTKVIVTFRSFTKVHTMCGGHAMAVDLGSIAGKYGICGG